MPFIKIIKCALSLHESPLVIPAPGAGIPLNLCRDPEALVHQFHLIRVWFAQSFVLGSVQPLLIRSCEVLNLLSAMRLSVTIGQNPKSAGF